MTLDKWMALCAVLLFVVYGYSAFFTMDGLLPPILQRNPIWPSTFPKVIATCGVLISLAVLFDLEKSQETQKDIDVRAWRQYKVLHALLLIAMMILYALCLRMLGFVFATCAFLACGGLLLGERRIVLLLVVSIIASGGIWYLVDVLLGIYMNPLPIWFDVSNQ